MTYHMPIEDAEELALWFIRHMTMKQRHALTSERPLLYARTFPSVDADTIIATVRYALDNQDTATVQFPGSDKFPGSGNVATVPAGFAHGDGTAVKVYPDHQPRPEHVGRHSVPFAHTCTDECTPGICEVQHDLEFGGPELRAAATVAEVV